MVDPPSVVPKTHSVAMTTARDAIVAFGAGHGALSVPVERRITQYLRQERFYAVGGFDRDENKVVRSCHSFDVQAGAWVEEAPMLKGRRGHGIALIDGDMWAVGGFDGYEMDSNDHRSCERFDHTTNTLAPTPSDLHKLAALVMCRTPSELCAKVSWDGTLGTSRASLLRQLAQTLWI